MSFADYLTISQTVFYAAFSFIVILIGLLLITAIYYLVKITRHVNKISENLEHASDEVKKNVEEIIENLSKLPLISRFLKHKKGQS